MRCLDLKFFMEAVECWSVTYTVLEEFLSAFLQGNAEIHVILIYPNS